MINYFLNYIPSEYKDKEIVIFDIGARDCF